MIQIFRGNNTKKESISKSENKETLESDTGHELKTVVVVNGGEKKMKETNGHVPTSVPNGKIDANNTEPTVNANNLEGASNEAFIEEEVASRSAIVDELNEETKVSEKKENFIISDVAFEVVDKPNIAEENKLQGANNEVLTEEAVSAAEPFQELDEKTTKSVNVGIGVIADDEHKSESNKEKTDDLKANDKFIEEELALKSDVFSEENKETNNIANIESTIISDVTSEVEDKHKMSTENKLEGASNEALTVKEPASESELSQKLSEKTNTTVNGENSIISDVEDKSKANEENELDGASSEKFSEEDTSPKTEFLQELREDYGKGAISDVISEVDDKSNEANDTTALSSKVEENLLSEFSQ